MTPDYRAWPAAQLSRTRSGLHPEPVRSPIVLVLAASIRSRDHLLACFALGTELVTVPAKVLAAWAESKFPLRSRDSAYPSTGRPIPFEELNLGGPWETFDVRHELTLKGIDKFVKDYRKTLALS